VRIQWAGNFVRMDGGNFTNKVNVSFYIAQYPDLRTVQSALHLYKEQRKQNQKLKQRTPKNERA